MPARFHRPELDLLRFGAFFLVFLHHALPHASADFVGFPSLLAQILAAAGRAGALGVDLFFALSAYLITAILLREQRAAGRIGVRAFYMRRILRIWPLYFFALLVLAPLLGDGLPPMQLAGFLLLSGNWASIWFGYPASAFALLWSVSIEEQFYLAWPWLVRIDPKKSALGMLAVATAARLVLAAAGAVHPGVWCNTLARLDPIAGGALLACLQIRVPSPRLRFLCLLGGAFGFLAAGGLAPHDGWITVISYPAAAASAIAILYAALGLPVRNAAFEYLGKISYGLYVFHVAALRLVPFAPLRFCLRSRPRRFRIDTSSRRSSNGRSSYRNSNRQEMAVITITSASNTFCETLLTNQRPAYAPINTIGTIIRSNVSDARL